MQHKITMRILLANYRYFISGGPERYMFNLTNQLLAKGHEVIPFSIHYAKNLSTPFSKYFVEPLGNRDEVYFEQQQKSFQTVSQTLSRLFYSPEVEKAVSRIIDDHKPQVAYVLHYLRKLSPALLVGLKKKGIPIVVRLSDYAMLCPQAHFLRDNRPCTLCAKGKILPSVQYRCIKGSLAASTLNMLATWYHRKRHFFDLIDFFVCSNDFMYNMMLEAGYPENKLVCIPTFTNLEHFIPNAGYAKSDYFAYCGRLTALKGVRVLLDAITHLKTKTCADMHLKIAGTGDPEHVNAYRRQVADMGLEPNVEFVGELNTKQLPDFLANALFSVVPSLWFENLPNSLIESLACGTPVIASNIGSLKECIENGRNGFLFNPGDSLDLANKIASCLENGTLLKEMATNARVEAEIKYTPNNHINKLFNFFDKSLEI